MKLVLYSGYHSENAPIDQEAVRLTQKKNPKMLFIPSASHVPDFEYDYVSETYSELGIKNIMLFNIDHPYSPNDATKVLNAADIVYLGGGNTYYFLKSIRRNHFDRLLLSFVRRGGVLAGLSAGAILMTPTIATASYPSFDRDENLVGIRKIDAMKLVNFEFFPHYTPEPEYARELKKQSKRLPYPIYGVSDGGGIVVDDHRMTFYGNVWGYVNGQEYVVQFQKKIKKIINWLSSQS